MSAADRFIAWCKQEQASLQQQLELLEASKVLTGEDRGSGWVNTTTESKKRTKERLTELESLLTETGSASLSKPADKSILPDDATLKTDTTVKKVEASSSPRGEMGQKYLVAGKRVSMRLWIDEPVGKLKSPTARDYETVGYVISGSAKLDLEGQTLKLKAGDSWLVPAGATHQYTIIDQFTAVEATAPPAEVHGRDAPA
jgi:quercetin dioxygenase-like cupin family protein